MQRWNALGLLLGSIRASQSPFRGGKVAVQADRT